MTTIRKPLKVTIDPVNHSGFVAGFHARRLIDEAGGRPLWSRRRSCWSTSEKTARDVIARAEAERIPVVLTEEVVA